MTGASSDSLVDELIRWASSELRLPRAPPRAVLAELSRPPRAAHLLRVLVARARTPEHVAAARAAELLRPDPAAQQTDAQREALRRAENDAALLEAEIDEAYSHVLRKPKQRARRAAARARNDAAKELKLAYADALLGDCDMVNKATAAVEQLPLPSLVQPAAIDEKDDGEAVTDDLYNVLCAIACACDPSLEGEDRVDAGDQALSSIRELSQSHDVVDILKLLTNAAEEDEELYFRGDDLTNGGCVKGDSTDSEQVHMHEADISHRLVDIRSYQMELFIEAEEAASEAREAENALYEEISAGNATEDALLLVELAGDRAAIAEAERIERTIRMCSSTEAAERRSGVERSRTLASRAGRVRADMVLQNSSLDRLAQQYMELLQTAAANQKNLSDQFSTNIPDLCSLCLETGESLRSEIQASCHHFAQLPHCAQSTQDAEERQDAFSCLERDLDESLSAASFQNGDPWDGPFLKHSLEIAKLQLQQAHASYEANSESLEALKSRADLICDVFKRDQECQDRELGDCLDEAITIFQDCVTRLVPNARNELQMLLTQPGRDCAPWLKNDGLELSTWSTSQARASPSLQVRATFNSSSESSSCLSSQSSRYFLN